MAQAPSRPQIDTLYPVSPEGPKYKVLPPPFGSELQRRLAELAKQDVGPR